MKEQIENLKEVVQWEDYKVKSRAFLGISKVFEEMGLEILNIFDEFWAKGDEKRCRSFYRFDAGADAKYV